MSEPQTDLKKIKSLVPKCFHKALLLKARQDNPFYGLIRSSIKKAIEYENAHAEALFWNSLRSKNG